MKICFYPNKPTLIKGGGIPIALSMQQLALKREKIPFTLNFKEDFDILHLNWFGPRDLIAANKAHKRGKKVVIHAHTITENCKDSFTFGNFLLPLLDLYFKYFFRHADVIIAPTPYAKRLLQKKIPSTRIEVCGTPIDTKRFNVVKAKKSKKISVCCVGAVIPRKGVEDFIAVAKEFPKNNFFWCGPFYNMFSYYKGMIKALNDKGPNVDFIGSIDFKKIPDFYASKDIFFFPSKEETQGLVILEAGAAGLPVIVRDIPVYEGWLVHGKNCFKAKNVGEFCFYLRKLIMVKKLREKMAIEAKKLAYANDQDIIGKKLIEIYKTLV